MIIKDLGVSFKDRVVFKNVNFEIADKHRIVSLVGRSGIGKTQMIRRLAKLKIDGATLTGDVFIKDKPVREGDVGVVSQNYYLPAHLTVKQVLHYAAKKNPEYGPPGCQIDQLRSWYIDQFELSQHLDKYCTCPPLSGGQRQRVAIVTQLLSGTDFLLMDEPFSGLDSIMIDRTLTLLRRVSELNKSKTILIVTHDLRSACAISDLVLVLANPDNSADGAKVTHSLEMHWDSTMIDSQLFLSTINQIKALL